MNYQVIRNATEPVGSAQSLKAARAYMGAQAKAAEERLRRQHPDAEIRVTGNLDSAYIDAMHGEDISVREFYTVEEAA